jgi:demethylmenaquinone methyltransferase/2-methoxy-6-polyprenyl-1,4-benzoquinol methylase
MAVATKYDAINAAIFFPSGGSLRLRRRLVDALDLQPGERVLELGCGTGQVTAALIAAGADVVAVDALPAMLDRARQRAPTATFIQGDAIDATAGDGFNCVALSFVLHGFGADERRRLLRRSATALVPGGRIGVLEWARPQQQHRAALWTRFLSRLEPDPAGTREILAGALEADVAAAGLRIDARQHLAGSRAQLMLLSRAGVPRLS